MSMVATTGSAAPTVAELVARARELAPLIRKNAAAGETNRRVADESIEAVTKAGLMRVCKPRRYGGWEMSIRAMLDVSSTVAEADGGTAWVVNLANVCDRLAGLFPAQAQDEVFGGNPDVGISGVLTPSGAAKPIAGGYRITGTWQHNFGGWRAQWAILGFPMADDAGEDADQGLALVPMSDLERLDPSPVAGMKSSGSTGLRAQDVFVPDHRVLPVPRVSEGDKPFHRAALIPFLGIIHVGPILGLGRAALNFVREKASARTIAYTFFAKQAESVAFQLQVADAALMIDTAHLHAYRAADDVDAAVTRGAYPDALTRARLRADTGYVVEKIAQAIDKLLFAHGSGGFADVSPLQRIWRDAAVAARHAAMPPVGYELYGRILLAGASGAKR